MVPKFFPRRDQDVAEKCVGSERQAALACRWALWLLRLETDLAQGRRYNPEAWRMECLNFTLGWAYLRDQLPLHPQGDTGAVSQRLYEVYGPDWRLGLPDGTVEPMEIDQL